MDRPKGRRHSSAIAAAVFLLLVISFVVYSSLHVAEFECEVCMAFEGNQVCRTVTGNTEQEGVRTGVSNACALLTSGMTNTMRCERGQPAKASCRRL
jgi:hypothetical protein